MTKPKSDSSAAAQNTTPASQNPTAPITDQNASSTASTQQAPLPPQDLESLQLALANAQQRVNEMTEIAKRATADLQNFKRRNEEERGSLILFANTHFLQGIFPVIDNLQRAFQHIPEDVQTNEWVKGLYAIEKQLISTLNNLGLEEIPTLIGSPFNPNFHEVVTQGPGQKDAILECFEKGYTFKGQTIRPARVKVGDGTHEA
ncbi:MAG: nucleotide exchange factor GrpE [Candidatus Gracilibacteria bacterium]